MPTIERTRGNPRSAGPFVTVEGRRLQVHTLAYTDVPRLVEFSDYLARRSDAPGVIGFNRAALEDMTEATFDGQTMIALLVGPSSLIRGVGAYAHGHSPYAEAAFTVDDALVASGAFEDLVYRIADDARDHDVTELRVRSAEAVPAERDAFEATGFPLSTLDGGGIAANITEPANTGSRGGSSHGHLS